MENLEINQKAFDHVYTNLLAQGRASVNETTQECMYRGPEGLKCAAGWLMSDACVKYEGIVFGEIVDVWSELILPEFKGVCFYFIREMQEIHDYVLMELGDLQGWKDSMSRLAKECGLEFKH